MLGPSFWVVQVVLLPVRLVMAGCSVAALAGALFLAWQLGSLIATPFGPLVVVLLLGVIILACIFGFAILAGLVWAFYGLMALRHGDTSRLRILRNAELSLAITLSVLFVFIYPEPSGYTLWAAVLAGFAAAQWTAWIHLSRWKAPTEWIVVENGPLRPPLDPLHHPGKIVQPTFKSSPPLPGPDGQAPAHHQEDDPRPVGGRSDRSPADAAAQRDHQDGPPA